MRFLQLSLSFNFLLRNIKIVGRYRGSLIMNGKKIFATLYPLSLSNLSLPHRFHVSNPLYDHD